MEFHKLTASVRPVWWRQAAPHTFHGIFLAHFPAYLEKSKDGEFLAFSECGRAVMNTSGPDGQCFVNVDALDGLLKALEGKKHELRVENEIRFDVALSALYRGFSLTEIMRQAIWQLEKSVITQVLASTNGNKAQAARILKIDYKTLYRKMHKYVI
jgi:DNA-binding protein Fis